MSAEGRVPLSRLTSAVPAFLNWPGFLNLQMEWVLNEPIDFFPPADGETHCGAEEGLMAPGPAPPVAHLLPQVLFCLSTPFCAKSGGRTKESLRSLPTQMFCAYKFLGSLMNAGPQLGYTVSNRIDHKISKHFQSTFLHSEFWQV
jgi:hypothetical protein